MSVDVKDDIQSMLDDLLTTKEVAEQYEITVRDVQYQIKRGRIKWYKIGDYFYVIHKRDLPAVWPSHT